MPQIDLKYGKTEIPFEYDEAYFQLLGKDEPTTSFSDAEIGARLDDPIDSPPLDDIIHAGETVLIVVPDATRETAAGQIVNLVVRRLIANGILPQDIRIIFATGIHRGVTDEEKRAIVTSFIAQRIKMLDHGPRDLMQIVRMGETSSGIPVELNRALIEHDRVIIIGGVSFHYFAGFTGGRKLVCPGLASAKTTSATHQLAFDCVTRSRSGGVAAGLLDGNAVHEAFMEAAAKVNPSFAIDTIVNDSGGIQDLFCGNWITSHRKACDAYADTHTIKSTEKRDLVIVSCGGFPHDINLIQAHKAIEAASHACRDGGTIVLLSECADGLGRRDFLDWFDAKNSEALAERLCQNYQVNGQTAWSILRKAERFDIQVLTELGDRELGRLRLKKIHNLLSFKTKKEGFILPFGAKYLVKA
ncbi:MAG: nickel-dependent lactate racemase [Pyrinomonadaceae bacterium]